MKYIILFTLVVIMSLAYAGDMIDNSNAISVAQISVNSEQEIIQLHKLGFQIPDAKIRQRIGPDGKKHYQVTYNSENGFVTVLASKAKFNQLIQLGYRIKNIKSLQNKSPEEITRGINQIPYQFGWPRTILNGNSLYENSPTAADMDRDGNLDISVTNAWGSYPNNPPQLIVWKLNGTYLPGFPVPLQAGQLQSSADAGISAMGDIYGDDKLEIICGDENGFLYAFNYDGSSLTGFPKNFGTWTGVFTPALADMDNDGKKDIAVISHDWDSPYGNAYLHLFKITASGPVEFPGYPINLHRGAKNSPAIGDIDGNGELEIVIATGGAPDSTVLAKIIVYSDSGQVMDGFPWVIGKNSIWDSPTLYDLDNDGTLEILIRVKPDDNINGIYALNSRGEIVTGFPYPLASGNSGVCVAVGDMDGDNVPEIAYGSVEAVDSAKVWVYNLSGSLLAGFPAKVFRTWVDGSVAIADVDGDGLGDVVCGTNGTASKPGLIYAFNYMGQVLPDFPISPGNPILNSFETHPTLVDIDGDGDTEIFAGRVDKYVYGWDTQGIYDSTYAWTTFKGNAARTGGQLRSPALVSIKDEIGNTLPSQFELKQNYPNPFNPQTTIQILVPERSQISLSIFNINGQKIATLINNQWTNAGIHKIDFNANELPSGVYFYRLSSNSFSQTRKMILLK